MAKTYQDTLTRTANPLAGSTSSDSLFTWTVPDGTDPGTNGTAIAATQSFTGMTSANCDTDDIYVEVDYSHSGVGALWFDLGCNGSYPAGGTGYEFAIFGGNAYIFAVAGGSPGFTQLATVAHTQSTGTYRIQRVGSALTFKKDGSTILSATDSSEPTGAGKRRVAIGSDGGGVTTSTYLEVRYGDIVSGAADPFMGSTLASPGVRKRVSGHTDPLRLILQGQDEQFAGPGQFKSYDWPNPQLRKYPVDLRNFLNPSEVHLIGKDVQFGGPGQWRTYDWPNPQRPARRVDRYPTGTNFTIRIPVVVAGTPFFPNQWANPRIKRNPTLGFEQFYVIDDSQPFITPSLEYPAAWRIKRVNSGFTLNLLESVLGTAPPASPFFGSVLGVPTRRRQYPYGYTLDAQAGPLSPTVVAFLARLMLLGGG